MTIKMPPAIEAYFMVDRDGGPNELPTVFTEKAVIKDAGETVIGHDAICKWKIDYTAKFGVPKTEPFLISANEDGKTQVTAHVSGTFPGSPIDLRYIFVIAGDKISELEITV